MSLRRHKHVEMTFVNIKSKDFGKNKMFNTIFYLRQQFCICILYKLMLSINEMPSFDKMKCLRIFQISTGLLTIHIKSPL